MSATITTFCRDCAHLDGQTCKHPESEVASASYMVSGDGDPTTWRDAAMMRAHEPLTSVHPEGTPRWCGPGAELFEAKQVEAASPPPDEAPPAEPQPPSELSDFQV